MRGIAKFLVIVCMWAVLLPTPAYAMALSDTLSVEDFVRNYNEKSTRVVTDFGAHRKVGIYEVYLLTLEGDDVMLVNVNDKGIADNIVILHKGEVPETARENLRAEFMAAVLAVGFDDDEFNRGLINRAADRLKLDTKDMQSSLIKREDIGRDFVFVKTYNEKNDALMISLKAEEFTGE